MQDLTDNERKQVLGEVLSDQLKAILEYVQNVPAIKKDVARLKEDVTEVKADIKIIKAAVTDISKEQKQQDARHDQTEVRLSALEAAA